MIVRAINQHYTGPGSLLICPAQPRLRPGEKRERLDTDPGLAPSPASSGCTQRMRMLELTKNVRFLGPVC